MSINTTPTKKRPAKTISQHDSNREMKRKARKNMTRNRRRLESPKKRRCIRLEKPDVEKTDLEILEEIMEMMSIKKY